MKLPPAYSFEIVQLSEGLWAVEQTDFGGRRTTVGQFPSRAAAMLELQNLTGQTRVQRSDACPCPRCGTIVIGQVCPCCRYSVARPLIVWGAGTERVTSPQVRTTSSWTSVNTGNFNPWQNPTNASASDDQYATSHLFQFELSDSLQGRSFGFSVPSSATILGISVEVERSDPNFPTMTMTDGLIQLVKANVAAGDNKADLLSSWPASDATASYGGPTDLWGTTWVPADINDSGFGIDFKAQGGPIDQVLSGQVDVIRIKVYFS